MSDQTDIRNKIREGSQPGSAFFDHFDAMPFHQYLGLKVQSAEKNRTTLRLHRNEETPTGIGGSVNGGVLATMVDMAAVAASSQMCQRTRCPQERQIFRSLT